MTDIAQLFARDPLQMTATDIASIVTEMRKSRHAFNAGNVKAGSTKPKTAKQKETAQIASNLSFSI